MPARSTICASAEGYSSITVWQMFTPLDTHFMAEDGLNPEMAFAEPVIERFFQALADAIAEHDARGWEDNAAREHRRAVDAYHRMLADS